MDKIEEIAKVMIWLGFALMLYSCTQTTVVIRENSEPTCAGKETMRYKE